MWRPHDMTQMEQLRCMECYQVGHIKCTTEKTSMKEFLLGKRQFYKFEKSVWEEIDREAPKFRLCKYSWLKSKFYERIDKKWDFYLIQDHHNSKEYCPMCGRDHSEEDCSMKPMQNT
ncbi:hypothetical protein FGO68_gene4417 [Halteria grandinella]|uniref:Uncharacterized protein n=1 Tax=Halteria grandinella TaxID=5974 RepID=A0A8J8T1P6_HALGN|nr:hypothetical protein FGO68_gene4417 [Halteria grandinella]